MRSIYTLFFLVVLASAGVDAQVKDGNGNELIVGKPDKPIADYNGGTISRGRPAKCVFDNGEPQVCIFFPRNGDGSFAIDVNGSAYYAEKISPINIDVDYDNGARMVPQGSFRRSTRDQACWVQGPDRKICVY